MTSPIGAAKRFRFTLRGLLAATAVVGVALAIVNAVDQWRTVAWREWRAQADLYSHGGVFSMASAAQSARTGGQSRGWFVDTLLNHVEAVDLSPHNWSAMERRGKTRVVDDEALAILHAFQQLRALDLRDTEVTDEGVRHLAALRELKELNLRSKRATEKGFDELREALPRCKITR